MRKGGLKTVWGSGIRCPQESIGSTTGRKRLMRIGLIGLGKLGRAVGERLLDCQRPLTGWNRSPQADDVLGRLVTHRVQTIDALVRASDAVIVLVRDDAAVEEMTGQLCAAPIAGKLVLQMS